MKFKEGVNLVGIQDAMVQIWPKIDEVYKGFTGYEATCTSAVDGKHMEGSFHYKGLAIDLRIWDVLNELVRQLKAELGPDFDVILEKDHIHVEFDPK